MNKNKPPHKAQKTEKKKQAFLTFLQFDQTKNTMTLKREKETNKKITFCHVQKQPTIFHNFLFFQHTVFDFEKLCFAENTVKIVFSEKKHSFSKTQLVKPTFSAMSKNTVFQKKVSFLVLGNFRWNHYFYSFSWFTLFWSKNIFWPKQIVCTKMRVFFLLFWHK